MNILQRVTQTKVYRGLNRIQKDMTTKKQNLNKLDHGLIVACNVGYLEWERISNYSERNTAIVKEIFEKVQSETFCDLVEFGLEHSK